MAIINKKVAKQVGKNLVGKKTVVVEAYSYTSKKGKPVSVERHMRDIDKVIEKKLTIRSKNSKIIIARMQETAITRAKLSPDIMRASLLKFQISKAKKQLRQVPKDFSGTRLNLRQFIKAQENAIKHFKDLK